MNDVIIIGAGIFGSTIARALKRAGQQVIVLDDRRPMSGSAPSAFLMKPSWFAGLGKEVHEPALRLLSEVYPLQEDEFTVGALGLKVAKAKCLRLRHSDVFSRDIAVHLATAVEVAPGRVKLADGRTMEAKLVIVAAGIWCSKLLEVDLTGKVGASFTFEGQLAENIIRPFAPYRQVVAFNATEASIWAGDGTAIKEANWTEDRITATRERLSATLGRDPATSHATVGIRPFAKLAKGQPCLLEERTPGLWLAAGGGKNGTIAAGWAAHRILQATS